MHFLAYLWAQMWPNIAAPSFWTVLGILVSHYRIKAHVNRKHAELRSSIHDGHLATKGISMTTVHSAQGRDVSDYQPVQSVAAWKREDFGIAKATESTGWTGQTFPANWANLEAAGIPRGAYHFLHPAKDPVAQAQHFYSTVKAAGLKHGDMLVVDSELPSGAGAALGQVVTLLPRQHVEPSPADMAATPAQVDACTKAFLDALGRLLIADGFVKHVNGVQSLTCPLFVYTMHVIGQQLTETARHYPNLWFAWPSNTAPPADMFAPWKAWTIWQWSFAASGGGDADAWNGDVATMKAFIAKYLPAPKPVRKVRKLIFITADGTQSLRDIARANGTNSAWIIAWTFRRVDRKANPGFAGYVLAAHWGAKLAKGIKLAVWTEVPAS